MTDHIQEQISAFIDDELSSEECAFLVRRLGSDVHAREQLVRYAAIGSALRSEALIASSGLLRDRVRSALDGAPPTQSRRRAVVRPRRRQWAYSLAGVGVAASVAVVALFSLRMTVEEGVLAQPVGASVLTPNTVSPVLPSYVVPSDAVDAAEAHSLVPPVRLTNYLFQHGNYTSTLQRTSVQSNVVGIAKPETTTAELAEPVADER